MLNLVLKTYPESDANVRAALRDLGLKVNLKEEWKGTGVPMTNDQIGTIKELPEDIELA